MSYAELLSKTCFSFLEGASHPEEMMTSAAELGIRALGIVDRRGVYGIPRAYRAQKKYQLNTGLIVGAEIDFEDRAPIAFLTQDRGAYGLLCRMITQAHADKPKGTAFLRWTELLGFLSRPERAGLIAIPRDNPLLELTHDYGELADLFAQNLLLPLHRLLDGLDRERTLAVKELAGKFGIRIIASNDPHFHSPSRKRLQDVMTSIRHGVRLEDAGTKLFSNAERYLKSPAQMAKLFEDMPEALTHTLEIAESCVFSPGELRYRYPSEWIPAGETAQSYLTRQVWKKGRERFNGEIPPEIRKQILHELELIQKKEFADYFLTIWEIVEFARSRRILCQGRGSAANSVVCYCLGITAVNPTEISLLFERFISEEREEPPDIDVDFEHERREEVIQHIYEKYGRHRAAMVAAVITYGDKLARREVSKALAGSTLSEESVKKVEEELEGFPRHLSIHSGGFTLSADPLIETVPIEPATMEGRTIIQWNKDDLDYIGLVKVDVLALGMLTAIRKALDLIGMQLHEIPREDPATYRMIQRADTVGVFQIESRAQMSMLPRLKPACFYDIVVQVAIVRPGPIVGKMVHPYLRRRDGLEKPDVPHPKLKPILDKTLGVPIFQEQVMKMAIELAGFTPGESDELRRAIGAWRSSGGIEKLGKKLVSGFKRSGLPEGFIDRIIQQIHGFAEYGFPESHAASFGLLAYASSYLKCHHPAEFTCALLNSMPMGFYAEHTLIDDAKRHGVSVLPLHPAHSDWDHKLEGGALRLGWRMVSGLNEEAAQGICSARAERPFEGLTDFILRTRLRKGVLEHLAMGDAFLCFGLSQREALWRVLGDESLLRSPLLIGEPHSSRPERPTGGFTASFKNLSPFESVQAEYSSYGLSARGHPMEFLRKSLQSVPPHNSAQIRRLGNRSSVRTSGYVIVRQRPPTAKGVVFATLEDEAGFADLILHRPVYEKYKALFKEHSFLIAAGTLQKAGDSVSVLVRSLAPLVDSKGAQLSNLDIGQGVFFR